MKTRLKIGDLNYNELKSRIRAKKYSLVEKVKKDKICFILWENQGILRILLVFVRAFSFIGAQKNHREPIQGKHIILISMKNSNYTLREDLFLLELIPDMNTCTLHMF